MDVTERRQTEAVVAAAADCEQTKLQVVLTRRLQRRFGGLHKKGPFVKEK